MRVAVCVLQFQNMSNSSHRVHQIWLFASVVGVRSFNENKMWYAQLVGPYLLPSSETWFSGDFGLPCFCGGPCLTDHGEQKWRAVDSLLYVAGDIRDNLGRSKRENWLQNFYGCSFKTHRPSQHPVALWSALHGRSLSFENRPSQVRPSQVRPSQVSNIGYTKTLTKTHTYTYVVMQILAILATSVYTDAYTNMYVHIVLYCICVWVRYIIWMYTTHI